MQKTLKQMLVGFGLTITALFTLSSCYDPEHEIQGGTVVENEQEQTVNENPLEEITDPGVDTDGDGVPDVYDLDDDNDGIPDQVESCTMDTDGDSIPNCRDLDSDNDGISDLFEVWYAYFIFEGLEPVDALATVTAIDADNNGVIDIETNDADENGRADGVDVDGYAKSDSVLPDINSIFPYNQSRTILVDKIDTDDDGMVDASSPFDTDGDGVPDVYDLDSDNDGVPDVVENGGLDKDRKSVGLDSDGEAIDIDEPNGIRDELDSLDLIQDNDGDGIPNHLDATSNGDEAGFDIVNPAYDTFTSPTFDVEPQPDGDGVIDDSSDNDGDGIADLVDGNDNVFGHGRNGPEQEPTPTLSGGADGYMVFAPEQSSTTTLINVRYQCQLIEYPDTELSNEERPLLDENGNGESYSSRSEVRQQFIGRISCGAETNDVVFFLGGENKAEVLEQNQNRLYLGRLSAFDLGPRSGTSEDYTDVAITPELLLKDAFPELETMSDPSSHPAVINLKRLLKSLDIGDSDDAALKYPGIGQVENNFLTPNEILIANIVHEAIQADTKFANTTVLNRKNTRDQFIEEIGEFFVNTTEFESIAGDLLTATEGLKSGNLFDFTDTDLYIISETDLAGNGDLLPASEFE